MVGIIHANVFSTGSHQLLGYVKDVINGDWHTLAECVNEKNITTSA